MKNKHLLILAVLAAVAVFGACNNKGNPFSQKQNFDSDASYSLGLNLGAGLRDSMNRDGVSPDLEQFLRGMKDGISGADSRFDLDEAREKIATAFESVLEERNAPFIQEEIEYLAENAKKPGIKITPGGVQYEILTETTGPKPSASATVTVHYEGRLTDGTLFDNSYEFGEPAEFALDMVIPGWSEGLQQMSVGSKYRLYIPSELGYGPSGMGPIPPYATLIFTVELLNISN
jgi:FKBP-type peptidyl-prolyl cis-trans isomerase